MKYLGNYSADGGSILLTPTTERINPHTGATVGNGIGDGDFDIYLLERGDPETDQNGDRLHFETMLYGDWDIREYDCELTSKIVATIESDRIGIYRDKEGNIYIEVWDEKTTK